MGRVEPSIVPAVVVGVLVVGFGVAVLAALALDRPDPAEAAVAYELAWDDLDFDRLWALSTPELRGTGDRAAFLAAKGALYRERADLAGLVEAVRVVDERVAGARARVVTRTELHDGTALHNEIGLRRLHGRWAVDRYRLGDPADTGTGERSGPSG